MMEPSEEILKALDEIVDVNLEEVGKKRIGKRSSILKQPRLDDDLTEDPQKRKSINSKRRVSFADKFQVMELCTGNVYDIPGRSVSASDSTLNGDSKFAAESEISKGADIIISKSEVKVSATAEVVLTATEKCLSLQSPNKKHKISSDKNVEPESKKINIGQTVNPEEIISKQEDPVSQFHRFLYGTNNMINREESQKMHFTTVKNAVTNLSGTLSDLQQKNIGKRKCDVTNPEILFQNKSDSLILEKSENLYTSEKCCTILGNKNSFNHGIDPKKWSSNVEVLPISLSDVPLEENKENIFIDERNKNVLVTNAWDLKLKDKTLNAPEVSRVFPFECIKEKSHFVSEKKVLQSNENFNPSIVRKISIINKQKEKSTVNKTCVSNHSMDLTCLPSDLDKVPNLDQSINDDCIRTDGDHSNKTHMDTSHFMELTCNMQNLTDSLSFTVDNDKRKQYITDMTDPLVDKSLDKSMCKDENIMEITCNTYKLPDNILNSNETNIINELTTEILESSNKEKRGSGEKCSQTKYYSSYTMELTCNLKNDMNLKTCNQANEQSQSVNISLSDVTKSASDKNDCEIEDIMETTCNTRNLAENILTSNGTNVIQKLSIQFLENSNKEKSKVVDMCSQTNYYSSCGMDLTCHVNDNTNLKIYKQTSEQLQSVEVSLSGDVESKFNESIKECKVISKEIPFHLDEKRNSSPSPENTKFINDEMDLTCYEKNNSCEEYDVFHADTNICTNNIEPLNNGLFKKDHEILQVEINNDGSENLKSNVFSEKLNSVENEIEFRNLPITAFTSNINSKSSCSNKTLHFTSDYMELTSRETSGETKFQKNVSTKSISKTKHFSSLEMDLTCNPGFDVDSSHDKKRILPQEQSDIRMTANLTPHFPKFPSEISPTKVKEDPYFVPTFQKTFSLCGMELTDDLRNDDPCIELVPNSPSSSVVNVECSYNTNHKSNSNAVNVNKYMDNQNFDNCKFQMKSNSKENYLNNSNLTAIVIDKKLDSNSDLPNKSGNSHYNQSMYAAEGFHKDFSPQKLSKFIMNEQNVPNSSDSYNFVENRCNTNNNNVKLSKRSNISDRNHEFEPDNKLLKFSNSLEPGIVYAIKQVKDGNQASPNDYNIFKFPEVFFPLKKHIRPKTSFSCSKIQFTKAVREAIRKSCSFSYFPKEWTPEFSEIHTVSKNKKSITFNKSPTKTDNEYASQCSKSTPRVLKTWKSQIKTVTETVNVYPDIQLTENSPFHVTNTSINKDNSLRKENFSISNVSPDTKDYLRRSLAFDDEINSSRLIISHVCEENIIENTAVISTTIDNTIPKGSQLCFDSSITLVPNDDSLDKFHPLSDSSNILDKSMNNVSKLHEDNLINTNALLTPKAVQDHQFSVSDNTQPHSSLVKDSYVIHNVKKLKSCEHELNRDLKNSKVLPLNSSANIMKQDSVSTLSSLPTKINENEVISINCAITNKGNCSELTHKDKVVDNQPNNEQTKQPLNSSTNMIKQDSVSILSSLPTNKGNCSELTHKDKLLDKQPNNEQTKQPLNSSTNIIKQDSVSILSSLPTKMNENEIISNSSAVTNEGNYSELTHKDKVVDDKPNNEEVDIIDCAGLRGNSEQNDIYPENSFEKIHLLRKKFMDASKCENCLWCMTEMDDKEAVFEILGDSMFACYLMCVDLNFSSKDVLCTQIAFIHLKEEPDDIDELGFSFFQYLVADEIEMLPFPADELLNKLTKFVDFALSAKSLIKDVSLIAIKNEISIKDCFWTPKLTITILNEKNFSCFNVTLPISFKSYPGEKIIPEITHIKYNIIKNEIIFDVIQKVDPGKKYLFRISEAIHKI